MPVRRIKALGDTTNIVMMIATMTAIYQHMNNVIFKLTQGNLKCLPCNMTRSTGVAKCALIHSATRVTLDLNAASSEGST